MERLLFFCLRFLPTIFLSRIFGVFSRLRFPPRIQVFLLQSYVQRYGVNLEEAEKNIHQYKSVNEFFTRAINPQLRPVERAANTLVSPVDGILSSTGTIDKGNLFLAKGREYSLKELLGDWQYTDCFIGGSCCSFYLSPKDCHRIYAPCDVEVQGYSYVPGRLLPVNEWAVRGVRHLFTNNERLVSILAHKNQLMAMVKVGAVNVGSIRVSYDENIQTNRWRRKAHSHSYPKPPFLPCGGELGRFEMGSTVILLFEKGGFCLSEGLQVPMPVRYGQRLGQLTT